MTRALGRPIGADSARGEQARQVSAVGAEHTKSIVSARRKPRVIPLDGREPRLPVREFKSGPGNPPALSDFPGCRGLCPGRGRWNQRRFVLLIAAERF